MFLSYKHNFKKRVIQVQTQFRFAFPQTPPASKTAIQKNVLKYQKDGTCLNLNKMKSGKGLRWERKMMILLRKIPQFHLISWCGNFAERHSFHKVSGSSPKTMRKMCLSAKFPKVSWMQKKAEGKSLRISKISKFCRSQEILIKVHAQQVFNPMRHKADDMLV